MFNVHCSIVIYISYLETVCGGFPGWPPPPPEEPALLMPPEAGAGPPPRLKTLALPTSELR